MNVVVVRELAGLGTHAAKWNELLVDCQGYGAIIMQGSAWVSVYLQYLRPERQHWAVFFVYDGERLEGVFPIVSPDQKQLNAPRHDHMFGTSMLVRAGYEEVVGGVLMPSIAREFPSWNQIHMPRGVFSQAMLELLQAGEFGCTITQCYGPGAFMDIRNDYTEFRSRLSKNFRSNLNKARNKLTQFGDYERKIIRPNGLDEDVFARFLELEQSGWKGEAGSAIAQDRVLINFYRDLCEQLAAQGRLEWHFLEADQKLLAAHMAVRCGRSLLIWKLAYDGQFSFCSSGSLLMQHVVQSACDDDGLDEVNLSTDQRWYKNWRMEHRYYYAVRIYSRKLAPLLFNYVPRRIKRLFSGTPR